MVLASPRHAAPGLGRRTSTSPRTLLVVPRTPGIDGRNGGVAVDDVGITPFHILQVLLMRGLVMVAHAVMRHHDPEPQGKRVDHTGPDAAGGDAAGDDD